MSFDFVGEAEKMNSVEIITALHVKVGTPRTIQLRHYQSDAIAAAHRRLAANSKSAPLVCLPTGSGKTIVIAGLIERLLMLQPKARFLVVTHTRELVFQDCSKFLEYACLGADCVGVASASAGRVETDKQVTFGTIQTLASRRYAEHVDYILIDEAHMLSPHNESLYRTTLKYCRKINKKVRIIGFTATPYRLDSGLITEGENALFTDICYEADICDLIRDGYLSPLISTGSRHHIDDSRLILTGADFDEATSTAEMKALTPSILGELEQYGKDRKAWLLFCVSIEHAKQVACALTSINIEAKVISSATGQRERESIIQSFQEGKLQALINVNTLTTGFDAPHIDLIVSLRPTASTALWVQICGRGLRIHANKSNCLVLDYANNIARHGPLDMIKVGKENTSSKFARWDARTAILCAACNTMCGLRTLVCPNCGTPVREERTIELEPNASSLPVLQMGDNIQTQTIKQIKRVGKKAIITVSIGPEMLAKVDAWAAQRGMSRAAAISFAVSNLG